MDSLLLAVATLGNIENESLSSKNLTASIDYGNLEISYCENTEKRRSSSFSTKLKPANNVRQTND